MSMLESLVEGEIKAMPDPSQNADKIIASSMGEQTDDTPTEKPAESAGIFGDILEPEQQSQVDSEGVRFDPDIHSTGPDGEPTLTKLGKFRRKKGVSNAKSIKQVNASREAGKATAETIFALCTGIMGDEWQPIYNPKEGVNERQQMTDAWAAYYEATGKTEMPPWVVVAIACSCYSFPRLSLPNTREKLERAKGGLFSWLRKRKQNKKEKESKND